MGSITQCVLLTVCVCVCLGGSLSWLIVMATGSDYEALSMRYAAQIISAFS